MAPAYSVWEPSTSPMEQTLLVLPASAGCSPSKCIPFQSGGQHWHRGLNGDTTSSQAMLQWEVLQFPLPVKQVLGSIVPWQVIHSCQDLPGYVLLRVSSWEYLPWLCRNRALKREFLCQVDKCSQMLWTGWEFSTRKPQNHTETVHKEPSLRYFIWTQRDHCQVRQERDSRQQLHWSQFKGLPLHLHRHKDGSWNVPKYVFSSS